MKNVSETNISIINKNKCRYSAYEMTQFIFEALELQDETGSVNKHTFKMYSYSGSLIDLFQLVDELSTSVGKIDKLIDVPRIAWSTGWGRFRF